MLDRLRHPESFIGPLLTLVSGTAVAHAITAGTLIVVARLYTPEDVGVLGLFASVFYILAVVACLRFEVAIPLPKSDDEARDVFWLALLGGLSVSASILVILLVVSDELIARLGLGELTPFLWMLPPAVLATACFAALQNWHVRMRNYGLVARARVAQSAGGSVIQLTGGFLSPSPFSLISGFVVNGGTAATLIMVQMWRKGSIAKLKPEFGRLPSALRKYIYYPRYSVWEALANSAAIQLPILMIGVLTTEAEVGQLMLALSVVQAPMVLFGTAASQVFLSQAPLRAQQGGLYDITLLTTKTLFKIGAPLIAAIALLSPFLFPFVFGLQWTRGGIIVAWMAPWILLQFIFSPVSMVLYIAGRQRLAFALQIGGLILRVLATWIGATLFHGNATEAYAIAGAIFYAAIFIAIMRVVRDDKRPAMTGSGV